MDRIMSGINIKSPQALTLVKQELNLIAPICRWTNGEWEELNNMRWDEIQNVPRHIRLLSNLVIRSYVQSKSKS
jgi:hypothetical protein